MAGGSVAAHLATTRVRRRISTHVGLALLVALTLGLSLFSIAGARRTQSSYPRFLRAVEASTMNVGYVGFYDEDASRALAALPQVERSRTYVSFDAFILDDDVPEARAFEVTGTFDGQYYDQDRFTATSGRIPDPTRVDEVAINELAAEVSGYEVGDEITLGTFTREEVSAPDFFESPPEPTDTQGATIVGIGVFPDEVLQDEVDHVTRLLLTPAYSRSVADHFTFSLQHLTLRGGDADIAAVQTAVAELYPPGSTTTRVTSLDTTRALQATRPLAIALAAFGVVTGLGGLLLVSQSISALLRRDRADEAVLRALGATRGTLLRTALAGPILAIAAGVALAVVLAVVASPLMPIGPVRRVEGAHAPFVDVAALGIGALVALVLLTLVTWGLAWAQLRSGPVRTSPPRRPRPLVALAQRAGLEPSTVVGLRAALSTNGASSSSGSVLLGAIVAIASLAASLTFGGALAGLVDRPELYGWEWDGTILAGNGYERMPVEQLQEVLDDDELVAAWSGAYFGTDLVDGTEVPLLGIEPGSPVLPPLTSGRMPVGPDEVVLGGATAATLHRSQGDVILLGGGGTVREVEVVGIAVLPTLGAVHGTHPSLGVGGLVVPELVPGFDRSMTGVPGAPIGPSAALVRFPDGTDPTAGLAHLAEIARPLGGFAGQVVFDVQQPAEITTSDSVGTAPLALAGALALGAITSLATALGSSIRRRRQELAILRTLGFTRRQLAASVGWQALTTIVIGLVVGLPLGVALGRPLWRRFADQLYVVADPSTPVAALAVLTVAAIAVALLVSVAPARSATRVDPALLLRPE